MFWTFFFQVKVRSGEAQSAASTITENYNWFYEGRNGWWEYDERACTTLEEAFNNDQCRSCELLISGFTYFIDFEDMVQFRKSHPARRRRIKRDRVGVERKGVAGLKLKTKTVVEETEDLKNKKDTTGGGDKLPLSKSVELASNSSRVNENNTRDIDSERAGESSHNLLRQSSSRELPQSVTRDPHQTTSRESLQGSSGELAQVVARDSPQESTEELAIETANTSQNIDVNLSELLNRTL